MSSASQNLSPQTIAPHLDFGDALDFYPGWPAPTVIVSDDAYGVAGFPGDHRNPQKLAGWYEPHIAAWAQAALPSTTLWFWNTEIGWAKVAETLEKYGWVYRACHTWDKGLAHVAGNVNGQTIRGLPVVTEVCVQYVREVQLPTPGGETLSIKAWLRAEWQRSGLAFKLTNEAAGVGNAASRKYFTADDLWYLPPPEMMEKLARYANQYGRPSDDLYFSLDGKNPVTAVQWTALRAKWHHQHGLTNVWAVRPNAGVERIKTATGKILHPNQKPLALMDLIIRASSDPSDVVWEPFGGLGSGVLAAAQLGRAGFAAEINPEFYRAAAQRLGLTPVSTDKI